MKQILLLSLCACFIMSCNVDPCQNKEALIKFHANFVEETLDNQDEYTTEQWTKRDDEFERLTEECFDNLKDDFTRTERKEFWKLNGEYFGLRMKNKIEEGLDIGIGSVEELTELFGENAEDIVEKFEDVFDEDFKETMENFGEDMKNIFDDDFKQKMEEIFDEDFKDDIKNAMKDLGEGLKEMGEELEKAVNEK